MLLLLARHRRAGGHIRETVRHVNAKYRLARWAPALSNVARGSASSVLFLRLVSHLGPVCARRSQRAKYFGMPLMPAAEGLR